MSNLQKDSWSKQLRKDPRMEKLRRLLQRAIALGIAGLIIYQLYGIGWREVLQSLPVNPLFYLIFAFHYVSLPLAEVFIYRQVWTFRKWEGLKAFLTKLVYNQEVVGYSGEFYLFLWGRKRVHKTEKEIFKNIRDNSILSAVTSNLVALVLLAVLLYTGSISLPAFLVDVDILYIVAGGVVLAGVFAVVFQFRRYLFELPKKKAAVIFSIYLSRFLLHHLAVVMMWMVAIPGTSWTIWFTLLAIFIVVNRIPFVPGKDLVFMSAGIEYARMLDVNMAAVAAMFLAYSALKKIINLFLFVLISYSSKDPEDPEDPEDAEDPEREPEKQE